MRRDGNGVDPGRIEVVGERIENVRYPFKKVMLGNAVPGNFRIRDKNACCARMNAFLLSCSFLDGDTADITSRLEWFLECMDRAIEGAEETLESVLKKARFRETHAGASFNDRQRLILNKLLDGFEGKLTSSKWAKLTKCSQDTAWRDIIDLVSRHILTKDPAGGRSASYSLSS